MQNPFVRPANQYVRDLNIMDNYIKNMAQYLSTSTGESYESAMAFVRSEVNPIEPDMRVLARRDGGDRKKAIQKLTPYLNEAFHTGRLLGPNLIMYENPEKEQSFLSEFISVGLKRRKEIKKRGQKAEMEKDFELASFCDNQQGRVKILNNSISGAHASPYNPLYNPTAHTTLTSVCCCATSYSNAVVEKLLMSNRHYYRADVALSDMSAIIRITDLDLLQRAMDHYQLVPPSTEYVLDMVLKNCNQYWRSPNGVRQIEGFIRKMSPIELSAVAYVGDLKCIRDNNDGFMRGFIGTLVEKPEVGIDDPEKYHQMASADLIALIGLMMKDELNGETVERMKAANPEHYQLYGAAIKKLIEGLEHYSLFIEAFLRTDNMPPEIHSIRSTIRHTAIVSDTDSTIFTTEDWVIWYLGKNQFNRLAMTVAGAIAYIDAQVLAHTLAMLSRHLGVKDDKLFRLAMKTEFYQPVMGVTNLSKHYFSYIQAKEGNVYPKPKFDSKGVNLKNSRLPKIVTKTLNEYIAWVMDQIMALKQPTLYEVLETPVGLAKQVAASLNAGKADFLMYGQTKPVNAYKSENATAWQQHIFWNEVFASKYGPSDPPPYSVVKVPVDLDKRAKLTAWMTTLEDDTRARLQKYLMRFPNHLSTDGVCTLAEDDKVLVVSNVDAVLGPMGRVYKYLGSTKTVDLQETTYEDETLWERHGETRTGFTNIHVPISRLKEGTLPKEIHRAMNIPGIECEIMAGFFIVLECCGHYMRNSNNTRLLSREIDPDAIEYLKHSQQKKQKEKAVT